MGQYRGPNCSTDNTLSHHTCREPIAKATAPIVIVGCRRSGTTLLQAILKNHPGLLVHPKEPQFILGLYRRFGIFIRNVSAAIDYLTAHPYLPDDLDVAAIRRVCDRREGTHLRELIHCYLHIWGGSALSQRRIVLKHPALIRHLNLVHALFPEAHIVHVVRDPRGSVSSQLARWPEMSVLEAAIWWRDAVRAGRAWSSLGKTPYTEVKYESLLRNPEGTLRQLCQSLGIPYTPTLLRLDMQTKSYARGRSPRLVRYTSLDPSKVSLWETQLTPLEVRLVEICCEREMKQWGYELVNPHVPLLRVSLSYAYQCLCHLFLAAGRRIKEAGRIAGWRLGISCW